MKGWALLGGLVVALIAARLSPLLGIAVVVGLIVLVLAGGGRRREEPTQPPEEGDLEARVASLERAVELLSAALVAREAESPAAASPAAPPPRAPEPSAPPSPLWQPGPAPSAEPRAAAPPPPPPPPPRTRTPRWHDDLSPADLLGARALAVAGGIVTVLGIVLVFILAVNRGWISPELRLGFGGLASMAVFSAGIWVHHRYGQLHAALGAAGAGIAGGFATLVAAAALYELLPELGALAAAAFVAGVAVAVALAWEAQFVALLGLGGALAVPLTVVVEKDELSFLGTGFAAIVLAGAFIVGIVRRWRELVLVSAGIAVAQIAGLVAQTEGTDWGVVVLAALFWLLFLAAGIGAQLRSARDALEPLAATLLLVGAPIAGYSAAWLFSGSVNGVDREGSALLVVAAVHLGAGAFFFRRARELAALLLAIGLTVAAVAAGELLAGTSLTIAWAGEAAILAWLAELTRERRFQLAAFAYFVLALGNALIEAPVANLFEPLANPASQDLGLLAAAAAGAALAWFTRAPWERPRGEGALARTVGDLVAFVRRAPVAYAWIAGTVVLHAASLALLELFAWLEYDDVLATRFEHGHVALSGFWALVALALVEVGMRRPRLRLEWAGLTLLGFAVVEAIAFDADQLADGRWPLSILFVAVGSLLAGFEYQRLGGRPSLQPQSAVPVLVSIPLAVTAIVDRAHGAWNGIDAAGGSLVLLAAAYGVLAALSFRRDRDLSTLLWAAALAVAGGAAVALVAGFWLVLAWGAAALVLAWLAGALGELRFQLASYAFLFVTVGYTLASEAPPRDLVVAAAHPAGGAPSLALVVGAALAGAYFARHEQPRAPLDPTEPLTVGRLGTALAGEQRLYRLWSAMGAALLALYALSLTILEIAEAVSGASVETDFQRGHTALSAFWGAVGLGLLTLGAARRLRGLRLSGFALFGLSLVKLFLYDLAYLSSLARALSFLAVGGLLLLGGFFYQRLSEQLESRDRASGGGAKPA